MSRRVQHGDAPTIVDVAEVAGVSKSTVSRVLGGSPRVSPEAQARVLRAMETLGYRTNQAARSLRTRKTALVGVLVPSLNEIYAAQAEGVDEVLRGAGVGTVVSCFGWSTDQFLDTMDALIARGLDGLILALPDDRDPRVIKAVIESTTPMVLIDREVPGANYDAVLTDQIPGMSAAVEHLVEVGRRSIGLIAMSARTRPGRLAVSSYSNTLVSASIEYRPDLVVATDEFDAQSGARAADHLVSNGVDAIVVATPMASLAGVLGYLAEAEVSYPGALSIVGYHEHELSIAKRPRLSVISRDVRGIGQRAAELIIGRLESPERPAVVTMTDTWFSLGESSDPRQHG